MDAINLLETDHRTVEDLFGKAEDETPSRQREIFKMIKGELDAHAHVEETIFYPKLQKEGDKELTDIVLEGFEEHAQMKKFLGELASMGSDDDVFGAKLKVLMEDTRHHVKEEENEMFGMVREQLSQEQLDELGDRMQAEKEKFQKAQGIKPVPAKQGALEAAAESVGTLIGKVFGSDGSPAKPKKSSSKTPKKAAAKPKSTSSSPAKAKAKPSSAKKASTSSSAKAGSRAAKSTASPKEASTSTSSRKSTAKPSKASRAAPKATPKATPKKATAAKRTASSAPKSLKKSAPKSNAAAKKAAPKTGSSKKTGTSVKTKSVNSAAKVKSKSGKAKSTTKKAAGKPKR